MNYDPVIEWSKDKIQINNNKTNKTKYNTCRL